MGKRELLLLVVFVVLGLGVYQVAAPAAPAEGEGFSFGRLLELAKAHIHGARERRTVTRTAAVTPAAGATTLDLGDVGGTVIVEGHDAPEIRIQFEAVLSGVDAKDLDAQERDLAVSLENDGQATRLRVEHREGRRPRFEVRVAMPHALTARLSGRGSAEVRAIAGLHLDEFRGELITEALGGPVTGELRDARAEFGEGATLNLHTRNGRLHAEAPAAVAIEGERGTIEVVDATGPVSIETDYCRMVVRGSGGPVTITGEGGIIDLRDIAHPLTIEADRLTVSAELLEPVPTTIAVSNDSVDVTLPRRGGLQLDASITDGTLRVPDTLERVRADGTESVRAAVGGGGPLVKVAVEQGELRIRTRTDTR